jgi:predicted nucleotidyltransferase
MAERQAVADGAQGQNAHLGAIVAGLRQRFEELYGDRLVRLILYGSQARREAQPYSDIDILVVLKGPVRPGEEIERTGDIVAELSLEFDAVIECLFVDEARFRSLGSAVIENAAREGVLI